MAKLENYSGSIDLISGLRQKNGGDFPLMDAHAIQTREDGTRLDQELDQLKQNTGGTTIIEILHDAGDNVATASHTASEIYELVQGGATVIAVVNGENRYPYKRATINVEGKVTLVEFSFTEVGRQKTDVTTYGLYIDESKDVTIWYDEFTGSTDSELEADVEILKQQMADLLYEEISITSFGHNVGIKEYGETVDAVTLSWNTSKTPTTISLNGIGTNAEAIELSAKNKALTGLSLTKDNPGSWTLTVTDERAKSVSKSTSITFYNGVYYGVASAPETYDSAFILGLTKELRNNKRPSFNANAGENQYIYYCLPSRMGECAFTVGGFTGGFALVDTIEFTNGSGYTEPYYIYRSDKPNLGDTDVNVK